MVVVVVVVCVIIFFFKFLVLFHKSEAHVCCCCCCCCCRLLSSSFLFCSGSGSVLFLRTIHVYTSNICRSCTKWNCLVKDLKDLPQRINEAFHIATSGRPGPVLIDLPKDVTAGILTEIPNSTPRVATRMQK